MLLLLSLHVGVVDFPPSVRIKSCSARMAWGYSGYHAHRDLITMLVTVKAPCAIQLDYAYKVLTVHVYSMCECDLGLDFSVRGKVLHFASRFPAESSFPFPSQESVVLSRRPPIPLPAQIQRRCCSWLDTMDEFDDEQDVDDEDGDLEDGEEVEEFEFTVEGSDEVGGLA